jgi:hypothetical protein
MTFHEYIQARRRLDKLADKGDMNINKQSTWELSRGFDVEKEHGPKDSETDVTGGDPVKTLKIALAHLKEDPKYYKKLSKWHKE